MAVQWTCRCGQVEIEAEIDAKSDSRLVCYCQSCRKFAEQTGATATLDHAGGVDLYQTAVERLGIVKGADKLAWTRLSEKGPVRWFAMCCGAPIANTLPTRQIPFATLMSAGFVDQAALPPILGRVNKKDATARIEGDLGNPKKAVRAFLWRALKSRVGGGYKRNPFFTPDGKLLADGPTDPQGSV